MKRHSAFATTPTVASTILGQLGGAKFIAMTGAYDVFSGHRALMFKIPRANDGINYVKIELTASDDYHVEFWKITKHAWDKIRERSTYADTLRRTFEDVTGLRTSL